MAKKKRRTKRPARTRSRSRYVRTQQQLADALRRSQSAIAHWTKRSDWPFGRPIKWPLKISDVRAWVDKTLTKDAADVGVDSASIESDDDLREAIKRDIANLDPLKKARFQKLLAETQQIKRKNQILDHLYMDRAKARAELAVVYHNVKTGFIAEARSSADAADALGFVVDGAKKRLANLLVERCEARLNRFADELYDIVDGQS